MTFTGEELEYLRSQRLGRLATVAPDGTPQNNPVAFFVNEEAGTIDIGGFGMAKSRKYRNVAAGSAAAFVVDDLVSVRPWHARGIEIRGGAEVLTVPEPPMGGMDNDLIRIHPRAIFIWGVEPGVKGMRKRTLP